MSPSSGDGPTLHPVLTADQRKDLVRAGVEHFNAGRYFEAHEAWEEIWRSTTPEPRDLWRGLIQVAVGLYHHVARGNPAPAHRVLARGLRRVAAYPQGIEGLDLEGLRAGARAWEAWLERAEGAPPERPRLRWTDVGTGGAEDRAAR
jgi:hypothetical protein